MNALLSLCALLTTLAAGFGVSVWFLRGEERVSAAELAGLSWLLGTALVSLLLAGGGLLVSGLPLFGAVGAACLGSGYAGIRLVRQRPTSLMMPRPEGWTERLLAAVLVMQCAAALWVGLHKTLGWDGLAVWEIKARYAFFNGGVLPAYYFTDISRDWSHPEYPLYLPMVETWMYLWLGDCHQFWVRLVFPMFYISGTCVIASGVARLTGERRSGMAAAALIFFVPFCLAGEFGLMQGYADFPLGLYYAGAWIYLLRHWQERTGAAFAVAAILAAVLPWVKREGSLLWLCFVCAALIAVMRDRSIRRAALLIVPGVLVAGGWALAVKLLHTPAGQDFLPMTTVTLSRNFHRLGPLFRMLGKELVDFRNWSLLWVGAFLAMVWLARQKQAIEALWLAASLAMPMTIYTFIYVFSAWSPYPAHVAVSLPRLLFQLAPLAVVAIGLALPRRAAE